MPHSRTDRLNSLLREVISEVIRKDVSNPKVSTFVTVTKVDISKDLHYAKVYISVIGTDLQKEETLLALQSAAGFIGVLSSKKVVMRHFPTLTFKADDGVDKHMKIDALLRNIEEEKQKRNPNQNADERNS